MFGLVNSPSGPWDRVTTSHHGSQVSLFLLSYRDSTFRSIFAVPNNAVFWITSNLTFTPIRFMYSLKLLLLLLTNYYIKVVSHAPIRLFEESHPTKNEQKQNSVSWMSLSVPKVLPCPHFFL